uniref:AlNc14C369G11083 protein n=1 Tax=Albugo laibachii Nc14 TaxID=890382 RepID=F0WY37_9STRA|nr:AlNc14C369G11083 [Albugo laibachii Nc14]|eukprot:CCA26386.1 AlNc14C369G11083 [Albugo laibachii Nc14]
MSPYLILQNCNRLFSLSSGTLFLQIQANKADLQCKQLETCYKGGNKNEPCTISRGCPACVTFVNNGCFELQNNQCSFGVDCTAAWASSTGPEDSNNSPSVMPTLATVPNTTPTTAPVPSPITSPSSITSTTPITALSATPLPPPDTSVPNDPSNNGTTSTKSNTKHKSEITIVFAILGAAIGVIAVGVIFLILVRRSGAHGDMDDLITTPPMLKSGNSTQYAKSGPSESNASPWAHGTNNIARPVFSGPNPGNTRAFEL